MCITCACVHCACLCTYILHVCPCALMSVVTRCIAVITLQTKASGADVIASEQLASDFQNNPTRCQFPDVVLTLLLCVTSQNPPGTLLPPHGVILSLSTRPSSSHPGPENVDPHDAVPARPHASAHSPTSSVSPPQQPRPGRACHRPLPSACPWTGVSSGSCSRL